jgi:outer membrane immunogenic protein
LHQIWGLTASAKLTHRLPNFFSFAGKWSLINQICGRGIAVFPGCKSHYIGLLCAVWWIVLVAAYKKMSKQLLLGISLIGLVFQAPALGADLEVPVQARLVPLPYPNWSGPYLGLSVGARFNAVDASVTSATVGTPAVAIALPVVSSGSGNTLAFWQQQQSAMQYLDNIAVRGGFYGGWNFQVAPTFVVGIEADFGLANETAVFHGSPYPANLLFGTPTLPFGASPNDSFRVTTRWDGSARLRGGWLATPSMLLYVTAGVAWANVKATSVCSDDPIPNVLNCAPGRYFSETLFLEHTATRLGWTAGMGVDMLLGSNWVARAQYRFSDFGYLSGHSGAFTFTDTRVCSGCPSASNPLTISYELLLMQHIFELGIAYKFN